MSTPTPVSKARKVGLAVLDGYNAWDIEAIMAYRAADYVHEILPKSLNQRPLDNTAYRAYFSKLMPLFTDFHVTPNDVIEDVAGRTLVMLAASTATTALGPYRNEYTLVVYLDELGDKARRVVEFVDSRVSVDYLGRLVAEQSRGQEKEKERGNLGGRGRETRL